MGVRFALQLLLLTASVIWASSAVSGAEDGFVKIFNGRDLTGWSGNKELWSVTDGAITGTTRGPDHLKHNQFLIWDGGEINDFELRLEFRLTGNNNSGVQYRSQHLKDQGDWVVGGYQADIHPKAENMGMLYDERGRGIIAQRGQSIVVDEAGERAVTRLDVPVKPLKLDEWHSMTIVANGKKLQHKVDGVTTVEIVDREKAQADANGILAFQVHRGPAMKIQFRNIRLKKMTTANELKESSATPIDRLKVAEGFQVELLYTVPKNEQGSWVNLCVDPQGRLIVSDQYGALYRVTPPSLNSDAAPQVEQIPVNLGEAQGLLWAFDSLYVMVNRGRQYDGGLYRVRDTDGDDQLDSVEVLRELDGRGEHGPHAILPTPDGKSLFVVCGDGTPMTRLAGSRVPQVWDEDLLLPRIYGRGFMKGVRAPGGFIARVDPDGSNWELVATGFRNQFDAALNRDGELFTYDADMEWDMNTPWYRPTRVCHVVSGVDFGWRNGGGKWPAYYPESLPSVIDIGPGSPTGMCFGYGARFPAKYQDALFIADWSYGKLYAVHLEPNGASYRGKSQEFVTGTPLPLTDLIVNPLDGALYFLIGGRRVQSGLYRVTYTGNESTAAAGHSSVQRSKELTLRQELEALHHGDHPDAVDVAWPHLSHEDRFLRHAARIAIELRPIAEWQSKALSEENTQAALTALLGLTRQYERSDKGKGPDIDSPIPDWETHAPDPERLELSRKIFDRLRQSDWSELTVTQRIERLRVVSLALLRISSPDENTRRELIEEFDSMYPDGAREVNSELAQLMVYLQAPSAAAKTVGLLEAAPTQEEQIDMAKTLRHLQTGWTMDLRERYFNWFVRAGGYRGGASFGLFVQHIRDDAVAHLTERQLAKLQPILDAKPSGQVTPFTSKPRPMVKEWKLAELVPLVESGLTGRDFDHGRKMFAAANCFGCHRYDNQGGAIGPDLTVLSGRFSPRDILESIVEPSKVVSDQFAAITIVTTDGRIVTGRIVNLGGNSIQINTDMMNPDAQVSVKRMEIDEMYPSMVSMMPAGLMNSLNREEILDLMAYLLSRGDRSHRMFADSPTP